MTKQEQEIMEILEPYDLTRSASSAAELTGCDPKTVQRYVQLRDAGKDVLARTVRPKLVDRFADKVEELVEHSNGNVRADVVHERLVAMGFGGKERTTRRAVEGAQGAACWAARDFTTGLLWRLARTGLLPAGRQPLLGGTFTARVLLGRVIELTARCLPHTTRFMSACPTSWYEAAPYL